MTIRDVVERHGQFAHRGDPEAAAEAWEETGLPAEEVDQWLRARCYDPAAAEDMADAGISPEAASLRTSAGAARTTDTVAFKVCAGELEVDEARDILGVH
ncbi:MAG TPA: hypothetical protein VD931_08270 [Baekduia sp.]|nr:hypothetical protein [Baekduia sp.]